MTSPTQRRHLNTRTGEVIDDPAIRPFADFLREQSGGKTHDEMSEALYDLAARVRDTGKKGTVTLTISIEPMKGDERVLVVSDEIRIKLPEFPRKPSFFFTAADGNLSRRDPEQLSFDSLREVPAPTGTTPKEIAR